MANGIISKLIKSGEWTPKIFDYNVYKFDWTSTGKYWKIGKLVIALFPYEDLTLQDNVEFSTMFCIGNLPMNYLVGSTQIYAPWFDSKVGGNRTIQGSKRSDIVDNDHACAYVRPNVTGTMPKNAFMQVAFIGYDL